MIWWKDFSNVRIFKSLRLNRGAVITTVSINGSTTDVPVAEIAKIGRNLSSQGAPQTATNTASLTDAQMLGGILVGTPTAAAAYTVRTGAQLEDALLAIYPDLKVNDTFDLTVINLGATTFDITMTAAAGITFVGEVILRPGADAATEHGGQGTWRFRYTAADTFIAYRVA